SKPGGSTTTRSARTRVWTTVPRSSSSTISIPSTRGPFSRNSWSEIARAGHDHRMVREPGRDALATLRRARAYWRCRAITGRGEAGPGPVPLSGADRASAGPATETNAEGDLMEQQHPSSTSSQASEQVRYEVPLPHVARITMSRPEARNAQGLQMTYELNAAFDRAARDDDIKVIILAGDGPHFSSGHDLGGDRGRTWRDFPVVGTWAGFDLGGAEGRYAREKEIYLEITERWRNLPK